MSLNPTPRQLSLLVSLIVSLTVIIVLIALDFLDLIKWQFLLPTILILVFAATYAVVFYLLKRYLFNRIRLIYKNIASTKIYPFKKLKEVSMSNNLLSNVEQEVANWNLDREKEIQSLKELENYRRNYIGDVSHELKTPLFNIEGYIHTLLEGGIEDQKINRTYLKRAAKNVDRLNSIIEHLNIISKLESAADDLVMEPFDIKELVEEVIAELEMQGNKRGITLELKKGQSKSFEVLADYDAIHKVLSNLIVNSIKYGKSIGKSMIGIYDMDDRVLVEVSDDGKGISNEHLPHIFNRFYRVDRSRSRKKGGSGLGLSIVKHILEAHEQQIKVRSTEGEGSTFSFTLQKNTK